MPELPEVETVKRNLKQRLIGRKILEVKINYDNIIEYPKKEEFIKQLTNEIIIDIERRGKWLIFVLNNYYLLSHLRMEGKFNFRKQNNEVLPHEHIIFLLDNNIELRYQDVRKFGKMLLIPKDKINDIGPLKLLGYEPWEEKLTVDYLKTKYCNKSTKIKISLLDQSIIAGIGNIYADEILFLSKISPMKKVCKLKDEELKRIIINTRKILEEAIKEHGSTIRSYTSVDGVHGSFQNKLLVHTKENKPCPVCQTKIIKTKVGQRGTYYCPNCQK